MLNRTQNPFLFPFNPFSPPPLVSVQKTEMLEEGSMKMEDFLVNYNSQNDVTGGEDFFVDDLLIDGGDEFLFETGTRDENASEAEDKNPQTPPLLYTSLKTEEELKPTGFCSGDDFCAVPADDVADLEWLSNFVEDSFSGYSCQFTGKKAEPVKTPVGTNVAAPAVQTKAIITKRVRTINKRKKRVNPSANSVPHVARRCTHCGVQKTPQWRAGPHGVKTLCNACGVRFKSGRLFPEYRPACSPTFSSEMHSNNHRKVLEMRVKKLGELSG